MFKALFDAERTIRQLQAQIVRFGVRALLDAAAEEITAANVSTEADEAALRLVRIAEVLGDVEGPRAVDLLIDILGAEQPEARHAAGEALEALAYDRFKEVALGVERALDRLAPGHLALSELPYVLAEVPEPGVLKLLARFLKHEDAEAVAAAIEALVEGGDPTASALLERLENDARQVQLEDDAGEEGKVTIGELAKEGRELLVESNGRAMAIQRQ
jgi:HEAT repeat protein